MKKILIVEDEQSLLKLLSITFKTDGYEVIQAINADEVYKGLEQNPDIILLDILLPGENGIVILEKIKKNSKTKHIPVIMLTNFNEPERFAKAKKKVAMIPQQYYIRLKNILAIHEREQYLSYIAY